MSLRIALITVLALGVTAGAAAQASPLPPAVSPAGELHPPSPPEGPADQRVPAPLLETAPPPFQPEAAPAASPVAAGPEPALPSEQRPAPAVTAAADASPYPTDEAFPYSSMRRLTASELASADEATLFLGRLEIPARHGYWSEDTDRYFSKRQGYPSRVRAERPPKFSPIEQANLDALVQAETERAAIARTRPSPGAFAASELSSFKRELLALRSAGQARACAANMRTLLGAVEMYNLDKNTRRTELTEGFFEDIVKGGYLYAGFEDPGQGPDSRHHYYLIDDSGGTHLGLRVGCRVHGTAAELRAKQPRPPPGAKPESPGPTAQLQLQTIRNALVLHDSIETPLRGTDLRPLVGRFLEELPQDPWGRDYLFDAGMGMLICYGGDGKPGGSGDDADLSEGYRKLSIAEVVYTGPWGLPSRGAQLRIQFNGPYTLEDTAAALDELVLYVDNRSSAHIALSGARVRLDPGLSTHSVPAEFSKLTWGDTVWGWSDSSDPGSGLLVIEVTEAPDARTASKRTLRISPSQSIEIRPEVVRASSDKLSTCRIRQRPTPGGPCDPAVHGPGVPAPDGAYPRSIFGTPPRAVITRASP